MKKVVIILGFIAVLCSIGISTNVTAGSAEGAAILSDFHHHKSSDSHQGGGEGQ